MERTTEPAAQEESALETIEADIEAVQAVVEKRVEAAAESIPLGAVVYRWLEDRLPKSHRGRMLLAIVVGAFLLAFSVGMLVVTIAIPDLTKHLQAFGYSGVFLANLVSTSTLIFPVPGLTASAQALIITQGKQLNPFLVGILGGTGMALGEITLYAAGAAGSQAVEEGRLKAPKAIRRPVERIVRWVEWLMSRYGFLTLLVLSAVPNPIFEFAGISAGASRMNFWRFMLAVMIGKNIRGLLLAFISVPYLT